MYSSGFAIDLAPERGVQRNLTRAFTIHDSTNSPYAELHRRLSSIPGDVDYHQVHDIVGAVQHANKHVPSYVVAAVFKSMYNAWLTSFRFSGIAV